MQFYRDGYRPGDPRIRPASPRAITPGEAGLPRETDVLIVGTGPAGCVLGAQLSAFPDIDVCIVERRDGPLLVGQADGVACRTVEMFQAFGLADAVLREAYWVNEVHLWSPAEGDRSRIERTGWVEDTPEGISEFPHLIVNQARMQQFLLEHMESSATRLRPRYGTELRSLTVSEGTHPVEAVVVGEDGLERTIRARYAVGCDGAHSATRRALGIELRGDAANHAWGVIDVLANTDFPSWRMKSVIQSDRSGSILMIPREGGIMVRCYVDLGEAPHGDSRIRSTTVDQLVARANEILRPYSIDVASVAWWSVYEVGQRVADRFDDAGDDPGSLPHVFIAGDACHTHSAKAGQGMNVSMQDAFNLGWKLAAVLTGRSEPALLRSYSAERRDIAVDLIEFDRFWSALLAQPRIDPDHPERGGTTPEQMRTEFVRQARYTAGVATTYRPSRIVGDGTHQALAPGFGIGTRFHSAPVVRVADAKRMELGHAFVADGRWRLFAFEDRGGTALADLVSWLDADPGSPLRRFTPRDADVDSVIDTHAVYRGDHHRIDVTRLPAVLLPRTGPLSLQDWEKVWATDARRDVFTARGVDDDGAIVVVRPDQYVAHVLPLTARDELAEFFVGVLLPRQSGTLDTLGT